MRKGKTYRLQDNKILRDRPYNLFYIFKHINNLYYGNTIHMEDKAFQQTI
jgi:hypothetical protein